MFKRDDAARAFGVTPVENLFIQEYLPAARGDYVKVYLWGLYQTQSPSDEYGVPEMAKELELTVPEVEAALRYWERRGLVCRYSAEPEAYHFYSPLQRLHTGQLRDEADSAYADFAESVYAMFGDKRKVRPAEIARAWEWVQDMGLRPEAVLLLLSHCMDTMRSQFSFKKAESLAAAMADQKAVTAEDAEVFLRQELSIRQGAQGVVRYLGGMGRLPSEPEVALYRKWRVEWQFSEAAVLSACQETAKGVKPSFAYVDKVLSGLRERSDGRSGAAVEKQLLSDAAENEQVKELMQRLQPDTSFVIAQNFYRQWRRTFSHPVLLLAAGECAGLRRDKMEKMDQLLASWQDKGLVDETAVREYLDKIHQVNAGLRAVYAACDYDGRPTARDRELYETWQRWGMGQDVLLLAARETRGVERNKLAYLNAVLARWHDQGVATAADAQAQLSARPERPVGKQVSAQQYTQREYTEEEMSAAALDVLEEAKKLNG
ncbi:MAG: DnaD domain protein [Clostridiales bacterium]|nr:DnaD domain protein [Clostridiales bacterium]